MQFASASYPLQLVRRTRDGLPGGVVWTSVLVFLLTLAIAKSTVTAQWVTGVGIEVVPLVAISGAILMGLLALTPVPWAACLAIGMVLGPVVAGFSAWPALRVEHPTDPTSLGLLSLWWGRLLDGSAITDPAFDLFLISWLMWVTGGWLAWCVLRWRRPLLGLVPGAAAFATTLLNLPRDQNGYVLAILVLTLALLLWTNYIGAIANATRAHVKLTGDARWDFWESGLVAMAALIVLAIMLPPLSTVDRTADMESSAFNNWAQLLQTLSHPGLPGTAGVGSGTTGFSTDVLLSSSLKRNRDIVFQYTTTGAYSGPTYFRGVDETLLFAGVWRYRDAKPFTDPLQKSEVPLFGEDYAKLGVAGFNVRMISPPSGNSSILFYPGRLYKVNRDSLVTESLVPPPSAQGILMNVDRLDSVSPRTSRGGYVATVEYSTATEADLQSAGTSYPDWVSAYKGVPPDGYRSAAVLDRIHKLALDVVNAAGATNPYDEASAIEAYLRGPTFTYTLDPPRPQAGVDPLYYFLFNSHQGYCEFFATAMGDMLRSLGIPTRLVNGFGPGTYESTINSYVVRSDDAHTWVEVYFPKYGWIQFEPTHDNVYSTIPRGLSGGSNACLHDLGCDTVGGVGAGGVIPSPSAEARGFRDPGSTPSGGGGFQIPDASTLTKIVGLVLAVFLFAFAAAARYLRPRTVMGVWRRTLALARLAGADQRPGETPLELGRRLAWSFPEASDPMRSLTDGFVVAAYAPPEVARSARASVMEAWSALRPLLLRRALARLRPSRV
jgi:transglutaminase-like putative cysteine protease